MGEIVGWRIVSERHARTAFSGEGARMFEGRWNSRGVRMVYCSESRALAALEILVHTQPIIPRQNYRAFRVSWSEKLMTGIELKTLPVGWDAQPPGPASKKLGDDWVKSGRSLVLSVPSVVVPQERTFLLNPQHRDFSRLKIVGLGRFALDCRLR